MSKPNTKTISLFNKDIFIQAVIDSVHKLAPQHVCKNPVMFVVQIGSILTTAALLRDIIATNAESAPLWFTGT